jgi:hypothetical protein
MFYSRNLLSGKRKYLWGLILPVFISVICVAFSTTGSDDFDIARREVLLPRIGSPNETIERSRLQKETWEDEGVIMGRSLDMFISKLRKKLDLTPISTLLLYVAKDISSKLALKKNLLAKTDLIRLQFGICKTLS